MRAAWFLLLASAACGQSADFLQGLESRFAQPGGSPVQDVRSFNNWFDRSYLPAFQSQPGWTPQRRAFIGRALSYLGAVRGRAGSDAALGLALAAAFNRLGQVQELDPRFTDREGALLSYQNSALILNQLANQNPDDPQVRGQLAFVGGRVNALGGSIPLWMSVPIGGQQAQEPRGIPEPARNVPIRTVSPGTADYPALDDAALSETERAQWRELRQRYVNVVATVYAARNAVAPVQASVESRGFALTPELTRSSTRMQMSLENAKTDLEQKQFDGARQSLQIAEGEARKILNYVGQ